MEIKSLETISFSTISASFNTAFNNYFVPINADPNYLSQRWKGARINPKLSVGTFDNEQLVAFMFIGIDQYYGKLTAHNDGTGVIPSYRGQRLVDKMYDYLIPQLKQKGVEQCTLEVIQANTRAQKVYARIGFKKFRSLNCYGGKLLPIPSSIPADINIKKTQSPNWSLYKSCFDFTPSWNAALACLRLTISQYQFFEIWKDQSFVGFAARDEKGFIPSFGIHPQFRKLGYGQLLFEHIGQSLPKIRTNNVEASALSTIQFLEKMGMENSINQFEMQLFL
jgi:ribosomal protein S18 acetylase RimI-like enzyme